MKENDEPNKDEPNEDEQNGDEQNDKPDCVHEPVEVFDARAGKSPWSDDPYALFSLVRSNIEGSSLKVHICKLCGALYSTQENWPDPDAERIALEDENASLRAELEALKADNGEADPPAGGDADDASTDGDATDGDATPTE